MSYEYKTVELKTYFGNQQDIMNALAKEGWELITVSFNIGYFKRGTQMIEPPLIITGDEFVYDQSNFQVSTNVPHSIDKIIKGTTSSEQAVKPKRGRPFKNKGDKK